MEFEDDLIRMLEKENVFNRPEQVTYFTIPGIRR